MNDRKERLRRCTTDQDSVHLRQKIRSTIIYDSSPFYGDLPVRPLHPLSNHDDDERNEQEKRLGVVTGEFRKHPDARCQYQNRVHQNQ